MEKRILSMLCAIAILMSMIVLPEFSMKAEAAEGLDLAQMQIVVPASTTALESTAASELANYIFKITGVTLSIVKEGMSSGAGIYIGNTNYAKNKGVTYPTEGDSNGEAWAIQAVDGNLILCGAPERGVLYAVYHLLEDVLGVRWWNMWEEYVPAGAAIVPAGYADSGVPAMEYRETFIGVANAADYPFYVRNRINGNITGIPQSYGGQESYGFAHVHTFGRYFTSSDFASHPEWFSLVDGSRISNGQLCLTNSELKTEFASRLVSKVESDPGAIYSISPNDNELFCQCESCQSAISTYGYSGYILSFVNEMAAAVSAAGYTDTVIEMLVYWTYLDVPKGGVTPAANVQVRFADNNIDLLHGINHSNNADTLSCLQNWADITKNNLYYWQYMINYNNNGILPSMFHYGDDITTLAELGVNGWFAEQEQCINTDFWDMKLWLIAKLMEEPVTGEEYAALMDDFLYGYYGDAAGKHIRDYLYYMHEKAEATDIAQTFGSSIIGAQWLSVQDIITGNECFEKAFAAAGDDATLLRRLRLARSGLDRVIVENYAKWQSQAEEAGLSLPFTQREVGKRIYLTATEQAALRGAYDVSGLESRYDNYNDQQITLPGDLNMDPGHYVEHTSQDMLAAGAAFSEVQDADSLTGTAIRGDSALDGSLVLSYAFSKHTLYYYSSATGASSAIGNLYAYNIKSDQGYQLYKFTWTIPSEISDGDMLYLFGSWGFQDKLMPNDLRTYAGKTVTVYLNMKVEGTVYGSGAAPIYYIDRIIVVPYSQLTHSYVSSPAVYGSSCRSVCLCGDVQLTDHSWNAGVISKEPAVGVAGEKLFTCLTCGTTKTESVEQLDNFKAPGHIYASYVAGDFEQVTGTLVTDSDAYQQTAIQVSGLDLTGEDMFKLYRYCSNADDSLKNYKLAQLSADELMLNQGYQLYMFPLDIPAEGMGTGGYTYLFDSCKLQHCGVGEDIGNLAGKKLNLYLSMKITGTAENATVSIDRFIAVEPCENYREGDLCSLCGEDLSGNVNSAAHTLYDYNYTHFAGGGNVQQISDADAYQGNAKIYTGVNLSAANIPLYRYEPGSTDYTYLKLGTISKNSLKVDQGYHTYSLTTTLPAEGMLTDGNFVYFTDNWTIQNAAMAKDLKTLAGKTVTITMSMKITGSLSSATVYVDRMQIVDFCKNNLSENGTYCTACGKTYAVLPEALRQLDAQHITMYDVSDFGLDGGGAFVVDHDSPVGETFSIATSLSKGLSIYRYAASGTDFAHQYLKLITIAAGEIVMNDGYRFYKSTVTVPEDIVTPGTYVYVGDNWFCQNRALCNDLANYAGKTVDFYISMKATGTDAASAQLYIDQMILVDRCENNRVGDLCSVCDQPLSIDVDPTAHAVYNYNYSFFAGGGNVTQIADADAYQGNAKIYTGVNLEAASIPLYRYEANNPEFQYGYLQLGAVAKEDLMVDQGYQTYSFTVDLPTEGMLTDGNYVYLTDGCTIQNATMAKDLKAMAGKTVTITMSMKITGELSSATVYVDRMQIFDSCADYVSENGTFCTVCGKTLLDQSLPEELQTRNTKHIKRYDYSHFSTEGGGTIVEDPDSPTGQAFSHTMSVADGLEIYRYAANGVGYAYQYLKLAAITAEEIVMNDGYHFYKSTVAIPEDIVKSGSFVYVNWYCRNTAMCQDLAAYAGKTVDFYISMKVTGTDAANAQVYIDQMLLADTCEGNWDNGVVVKEPTEEEKGVKTYTCTVCGATKTESIAKLSVPVTSWNLVLDGNISMNFVLNVNAGQARTATVSYIVDGAVTTKKVSELMNEDGQAILTVELAAAQMTEDVNVVLYVDGQQIEKAYTVRGYSNYIMTGNYSAEAKNLITYMLAYGAASQSYFGYNTDQLADKGMDITAAAVPTEGSSMDVTGQVSGVQFYGASLVHENKLAVRFYFAADSLEGISFGAYEPVQKGDMYYVEIGDICPQDLEQALTVSVTDGTDIQTITYAPMDYIIRMYAKGGDSAALVQALYGYYLAAKAYTAS